MKKYGSIPVDLKADLFADFFGFVLGDQVVHLMTGVTNDLKNQDREINGRITTNLKSVRMLRDLCDNLITEYEQKTGQPFPAANVQIYKADQTKEDFQHET